jgi:hypothetical protein
VIRDGLRALEDREKLRALKLEALRADIQQGINSGPSRPLQQVNVELQAYSARAELGVGLRCCVHQRYVIFFSDMPELVRIERILLGSRDITVESFTPEDE